MKSPLGRLSVAALLIWLVCNVLLFFLDRERWKETWRSPFLLITLVILLVIVGVFALAAISFLQSH